MNIPHESTSTSSNIREKTRVYHSQKLINRAPVGPLMYCMVRVRIPIFESVGQNTRPAYRVIMYVYCGELVG